MERIVSQFWRYVSRQTPPVAEMHVNRIASGNSQDRSLAAFKAEQARRAAKQDGATFQTKRANNG